MNKFINIYQDCNKVIQITMTAVLTMFNPYHAEFLKWNDPPSIFGTIHYHFRDIKMKTKSWSANSIEPGQTARMVAKANHFQSWQDKG